ncbi:MAG: DMT family transporter [Hyphomicrobiales bacterium]|nr:DMT family transporter [Hyphomicrobiales bacterium]
MLLGACLSASYGVMSRPLITRYSALLVMASGMVAGSLGLLAVALVEHLPILPELTGWQWSLIVFLAVPGSAGAFYLLVWAYGKTAPTRVAIFLTFNPIVAMLAGSAFLGEPLSTLQVAALGLVLAGVGVVSLPVRVSGRAADKSSMGMHAEKPSA